MLGSAFAVSTYAVKDVHIHFIFKATFGAVGLLARLPRSGVFLEKVFDTPVNGRRSVLSDMHSPRTTFQIILFFVVLRYFKLPLKDKKVYENWNTKAASRAVLVVKVVVMPWSVLLCKHLDISFGDGVQTYIFSDSFKESFSFIRSRSNGYALPDQLRSADIGDSPPLELRKFCPLPVSR